MILRYLNQARFLIFREVLLRVRALAKENAKLRARAEKAETQLAGCGAAALGWNDSPAKPGDYGYSASYNDVLKLRRDFEALNAENERLRLENKKLRDELALLEFLDNGLGQDGSG